MAKDEKDKLLRVGIIQDRRVVEERLLRKHSSVSVGQSPKNTFIIPNPALPKAYTLFEARADGTYTLQFDRGMNGRIDLGDAPMTLAELAKSKYATKKGGRFLVDLTPKARGKVVFGNVTLLFQYVDAPPVVARTQLPAAAKGTISSQLEWPLVYVLVVSFLTVGGGGAALDYWWNKTGKYYYNSFDSNRERIYELLEAEAEAPEPEEPKEKEEEPEEEKPEEEPEAEAEPEPQPEPPKPKPKPKVRQIKKTGPPKRETNRKKLSSSVRNKTFLGTLGAKSADGTGEIDALRNGVQDVDFAKAMGTGDGIVTGPSGDAQFVGGPAASTDGSKYKALSGADTGGKRLAAKTVKTTSKETRGEIKVRGNVKGGNVSGQTGTGQIDKGAVARVFARRKGAIKYCYEKRLKVKPSLKGKVTIRFTIGPAGRITSIKDAGNTTGDGEVAQCIIGKVKGWRFDPPTGGSVTFTYPFLLESR